MITTVDRKNCPKSGIPIIGNKIVIRQLGFIKDNRVQEWLKRCWWGNGPDAKYPDLETELAQIKLA